jgi:hypothetical protein
VAFELVGMLSKCLHIKNSCFRMLPNPTPYHWDKKFFSLRKLLQEYKKKVQDEAVTDQSQQVRDLARLAEEVECELLPGPQDFSITLLDALHDAIDKCDEFLTEHVSSRELVTMVLREHFQEILRMVNNDAPDSTTAAGNTTDRGQAPASATTPRGTTTWSPSAAAGETPQAGSDKPPPRFDDLNAASPEEKQQKFMDIYFDVVLPRVRVQAAGAFRRHRTTHYAPSHHGRDPSVGSQTADARPGLQETQSHASGPTLQPGLHIQIDDSGAYDPNHSKSNGDGVEHDIRKPLMGNDVQTQVEQAHDIWCTLVFRMLCWLLLHDFHKKDVQISKSELLGSRLPVYIA